jgi:hypothetical protein
MGAEYTLRRVRRAAVAVVATACTAVGMGMTAQCGGLSHGSATLEQLDGDAGTKTVDADAAPNAVDAGVARAPAQHRAAATVCQAPRPAGHPVYAVCVLLNPCDPDAGCSDSECDAGVNGRCNCGPLGFTPYSIDSCSYDECASDNDCCDGGAACTQVCLCRESALNPCPSAPTKCLQSGCRVDSDCGDGGYCSPSPVDPGDQWSCIWNESYAFYCHTPRDECIDDADCSGGRVCRYDNTSRHWLCANYVCAVDGS